MSELSSTISHPQSYSDPTFASSKMTALYRKSTTLWVLLILAAASFCTTLYLPYSGEEGVYTILSLEMWLNKSWFTPTQYGAIYGRPPLFNWLMIPLADWLGWDKVLLASRLVSSLATLATTAVLYWFTQQLFKKKNFALFVCVTFLSGDLLLRRGWLAYADPLFSFFVFSTIALTCLAVLQKKYSGLILAMISVIAAFLTKALTAYIFWGITLSVLAWQKEHRRFFFHPKAIFCFLIALGFPLLWNVLLSHGSETQNMILDMIKKLTAEGSIIRYLRKLIVYPLDAWLRFLPLSALVLYFLWESKRKQKPLFEKDTKNTLEFHHFKTAVWVIILNFLPYWIAPQAHVRYLLPLYPLIALCLCYCLVQINERVNSFAVPLAISCLTLTLMLKYILGFWGYGFIETKVRGNYHDIAKSILQKTRNFPLCIEDSNALGLSVTAEIDVLQLPRAPLKFCASNGNHDFLLLSNPSIFPNTKQVETYTAGSKSLYLVCRGEACAQRGMDDAKSRDGVAP